MCKKVKQNFLCGLKHEKYKKCQWISQNFNFFSFKRIQTHDILKACTQSQFPPQSLNKQKTDNKNWIPGYNQNNKLQKNSIFKSKVD